MKKFILRITTQRIKNVEVEAESWDDAKIKLDDFVDSFEVCNDSVVCDSSIEFVGDID